MNLLARSSHKHTALNAVCAAACSAAYWFYYFSQRR